MNDRATIPPEWLQCLQAEAPVAEKLGRLTAKQLEVLCTRKAFRMFLPQRMGGLAMGLPEALHFEEQMARIDGSLGWTLTLCAGATLFAGYMQAPLAERLLAPPEACFGGSGASTGIAIEEQEGYCISGFWKYATGAPHLTAFTANCKIWQDGKELSDTNGRPRIRSFVFLKEEVKLHEDWHTMGLCATAGHAFEVAELWVPAERSFQILPENALCPEPIFQFPFQAFAEATLAANHAGMGQHFLDCCEKIFSEKKLRNPKSAPFIEKLFQEAESTFHDSREHFFDVVESSWEACCAERICSEKSLQEVGAASRVLARLTREMASRLFPYCGMAALDPGSEINRVWRDLFTASQHSLLNPLE
ncbi:MAG: acyl-CoA dehydrogenase [Bacteroidetes bacterium]|nr:acyl-CoA dehydrogenase [Bacteroidota bacterium]MBS1630713.1 acyl-CoA dehydrogenase [Bacteroidota bacterium]